MEKNSGGSWYPERTHPSDNGDSGELNLGQLWKQQLFCQGRVIHYSFSDQLSRHHRANLCSLAACCSLKQIYKLRCRCGDCLLIPLIPPLPSLVRVPLCWCPRFFLTLQQLYEPSLSATVYLSLGLVFLRVSIFTCRRHRACDSGFPHDLSLFGLFSSVLCPPFL